MDHNCPAPGCPATGIAYDVLACKPHWFKLPKDIRDEVWAGWRDEPKGPRHLVAIRSAMDYWRQDPSRQGI